MAGIQSESQKLAYRIDEAVKASGLGRSFLYERMAAGELKSIKVGGRRLILHTDLVDFLTRPAISPSPPISESPPHSRRKASRNSFSPRQLGFPWSES